LATEWPAVKTCLLDINVPPQDHIIESLPSSLTLYPRATIHGQTPVRLLMLKIIYLFLFSFFNTRMNTKTLKIKNKCIQPKSESLPPTIRKLGAFLLPHVSCDGNLDAMCGIMSSCALF